MLEGKIEGLRGSLEFEFNTRRFRETGVLLSFHEQNGVSLEWTGSDARLDQLQSLTGEFTFRVFIPSVQVVHNESDGGGAHFRCNGPELCTSFENPDPRGRRFSMVWINVPLLHKYMNVAVPGWQSNENYDRLFEWKDANFSLGDSFPENASIVIRITSVAENDRGSGISLRPRPQVGITFENPIDYDVARPYAAALRDLFEILSSRPSEELTTRFYTESECVVLREPLGKRSLGTSASTPLSLTYGLCSPHLPQMITPWLTKIGRSPAVSYLQQLLYFPALSLDLRYFMAFSALGYLNVEQRHGGNHRKKIPEIEHLNAFDAWWRLLVPNVSSAELGRYLSRVANTRHDIAHLSRPKHQILSEKEDLLRGFNQLHVLARACLFESIGLPPPVCESYVRSMSAYLANHFDPVPAKLLA